jgi:hypothetical protein
LVGYIGGTWSLKSLFCVQCKIQSYLGFPEHCHQCCQCYTYIYIISYIISYFVVPQILLYKQLDMKLVKKTTQTNKQTQYKTDIQMSILQSPNTNTVHNMIIEWYNTNCDALSIVFQLIRLITPMNGESHHDFRSLYYDFIWWLHLGIKVMTDDNKVYLLMFQHLSYIPNVHVFGCVIIWTVSLLYLCPM